MGGWAMNNRKLPKGWRLARLSDVLEMCDGGVWGDNPDDRNEGVPVIRVSDIRPDHTIAIEAAPLRSIPSDLLVEKILREGDIVVVKSSGSHSKIISGRTALVTTDLDGKCAFSNFLFRLRANPRNVHPYYLFYFLNTSAVADFVRSIVGTTTYPNIRPRDYVQLSVPLPPLPVQERIVEILQKADEIRRKRREALELADKILPALFLEMFGDPATNPKGWPTVPFEDSLLDITRECKKVQQHEYKNSASGACPVIDQGEDFIGGYIDDTTLLYKGMLPVILFGDHTRRFKFVDFPFVLGADGTKALSVTGKFHPEYIYWHLRLAQLPNRGYERHFKFVRELRFMCPPANEQKHFANIARHYAERLKILSDALASADATFQSVLSRAFTGELTVEWEAANAEEIAAQQAFHERLPRLLVLALIAEKAKRASRAAAEVLVTALMKYVFLLQMEGNGGRRRLYHFVPYHYGPFAKELYADLKKLQEEGLVTVDNDSEEEKTRIALADPERAEQALAALPDDLKEDVAAIIENYGRLDHNALLKAVYEKYPAYARKSRLKRRTRGS
jgi:type I restriction enzyme S subunit